MPAESPFPSASLPLQLTGFVGREAEVESVQALLRDARLVTLTGAGGSGKTRLAIAVASERPERTAWVELASITDPNVVAAHIAMTLGARTDAGVAPEQALAAVLHDGCTLLVLDNCEHLVDSCAVLVDRLLRACPGVRVLATSREALGVTGERSWLVPTLSLPADRPTLPVDEALRSGAVQLFAERARDARPGFALSDGNVDAVVQVCRRLDGLPLALELAAARIAVLTPAQLAERLDDRFTVLGSGSRTAPPRHRTLRGAVDWSYELLPEPERLLFQRLAVFAGGFTLEAAEAVCADGRLPASTVLELLASLASKSLVAMQEQEDGQARYRLLETIREYAIERLRAGGDVDALAERHAAYYRDLVRGFQEELYLARAWRLAQVDAEYPNLMAALQWSARAGQGSAVGLPVVWALLWYWYHRQLWREALALVEQALATARDPSPALRAAGMHGRGVFGLHVGDPRTGEWLQEARRGWVEAGDDRWRAFTLLVEVVAASIREDWVLARQFALEMMELADRQPDPWDGALARAHALVPVLVSVGDYAEADCVLAGAVNVFKTREYFTGVAFALDAQSFVALRLGDVDRAARLAVESLRADPFDENWWLAGRSLRVLAGVAEARGDLERAIVLSTSAESMYAAVGAARLTAERAHVNALPDRLVGQVPDEAFAAARERGRRATVRDIIDYAVAGAEVGAVPPKVSERALAVTGAFRVPTSATEDAPALEIRTLGRVEILRDGRAMLPDAWPYAKPRELLFYLAAHPEGRTREQIGLDFWPEVSAAQVKNNFHVTLHHLRKTLGGNEWVAFERGRYRLAGGESVRDEATRFELDVTEGRRWLRAKPSDASAARLAKSLDCYRGPYLDDEEVGDWHVAVRDRLARTFEGAALDLGEFYSVEGRHADAADCCQRVLAMDAVNEEAARLLMMSLARAERRAEALRVYDRLCEVLRRDLSAEPSAGVREVAGAIRAGTRV